MSAAPVKFGKYAIHLYPPSGGVGGAYATLDEPNKPVMLYAMVPKFLGKQQVRSYHVPN